MAGHARPALFPFVPKLIERALTASGGLTILPEHLQLLLQPGRANPPSSKAAGKEMLAKLPLNLAEAEDALIQRALDETHVNIAEAARRLGVHRTRIYRKPAQEEPAKALK